KYVRSTVASLLRSRKYPTAGSARSCSTLMLFAPQNPRFVEDSRRAIVGPLFSRRATCHSRNRVTEPSVEPLSTTTIRAGPGVAVTSDSRHDIVSARPFQLITTTPTSGGFRAMDTIGAPR